MHVEERCKHGRLVRQCRCPRPPGFKATIVPCPGSCPRKDEPSPEEEHNSLLSDVQHEDARFIVQTYLDEMITFWRNELMGHKFDKLICRCYIDAYQSARSSLIGCTLPPTPELVDWMERSPGHDD